MTGAAPLPTLPRVALGLGAVVLLVCAWFAGLGVVGAIFVLEAGVLAIPALTGRHALRLRRQPGIAVVRPSPDPERISSGAALAVLVGITTLGFGLRLVGLDTDLWTDEIVTVRQFAALSPFEIFHTYGAANNHLLNTYLIHLSISAFGYAEWAIRLPAMLAGVLTVPATYRLARLVHTRGSALVASAAVAVAYQHVFFSQNARGYALMMLFATVSTTAVVQALRDDRLRHWLAAAGAATLCVASVPTGAFVVVGQALVVTCVLGLAARRGDPWRGLAAHAAIAFAVVAVVVLQIYAGIVAHAAGVAQTAWQGDVGVKPLSRAFLSEVGRAAGIGTSPAVTGAAIVLGLVGLLGLVSLARRGWALLASLVLGPSLHLLFTIAKGFTFSPRFLVFWLFAVVLIGVETIAVVRRWCVARGRARVGQLVFVVGAAGLCLALVAPSRLYLGKPKQRFREAILDAEARAGGGMIGGVATAANAVRYYGDEHPVGRRLVEGRDYGVVRSVRQLAALEQAAAGRPVVLLTTLAPDLHGVPPPVAARIRQGWRVASIHEGTIPHGDVVVWVQIAG